MRYEPRFRNGRWTVFCYWTYKSISAHSLKRDADRAAHLANQKDAR